MRLGIFAIAALLELSGCYLMWLGLKQSSLLLGIGGAGGLRSGAGTGGGQSARSILCRLWRHLYCGGVALVGRHRQAHAGPMGYHRRCLKHRRCLGDFVWAEKLALFVLPVRDQIIDHCWIGEG